MKDKDNPSDEEFSNMLNDLREKIRGVFREMMASTSAPDIKRVDPICEIDVLDEADAIINGGAR